MKAMLRQPADFIDAGLTASSQAEGLSRVVQKYSAAMSTDLLALVDRDASTDPIARQFVPDIRELDTHPSELRDPIGDDAHSPVPGVVHRYPDRVLLKIVSACPVYCRFCFRRESVGDGNGGVLSDAEIDAAFTYIAAHSAIWEVILTGGDPLALSPRRLSNIMRRLGAIDHVKTIRLHTRVPVVLPNAVKRETIDALRAAKKPVYVALHANHPRELSDAARAACAKLVDAGIPMVSQTVLLAGVNDDDETLAALMRAFVESRIKPYYLHHPDLAPGTAHFRVPIERGRAIVAVMQAKLSGLARPRYVLDIPGGFGKVSIEPDHASQESDGTWSVRDPTGRSHAYKDVLAARSADVSKKPDCN